MTGIAADPAAILLEDVNGEIYVGIAMLLGLTTRLAAMVSIFMLLNYWFAKSSVTGIPGPGYRRSGAVHHRAGDGGRTRVCAGPIPVSALSTRPAVVARGLSANV
jgi:uncharacterized membrane protein YphA (DoxX/SURF4 family)